MPVKAKETLVPACFWEKHQPAFPHKQSFQKTTYKETATGSYLMLQENRGLLLRDGPLFSTVVRIAIFGSLTGLLGKAANSYPFIASHLPMTMQTLVSAGSGLLFLNTLLGSLGSPYRHTIRIADNPSLARHFSIDWQRWPGSRSQLLRFHLTPTDLSGQLLDKGYYPLQNLASTMQQLGSDAITLSWPGTTSSVFLQINLPKQRSLSLMVPGWGIKLYRPTQRESLLPAFLSFLSPEGLIALNHLLQCLYHNQPACGNGLLEQTALTDKHASFLYRPDNTFDWLTEPVTLTTTTSYKRHIASFSPCPQNKPCPSVLAWNSKEDHGPPDPEKPVLLYSEPVYPEDIPPLFPVPPGKVITSLEHWQWFLITPMVYLAAHYGTDYLISQAQRALGLSPALTSGLGAGFFAQNALTHRAPIVDEVYEKGRSALHYTNQLLIKTAVPELWERYLDSPYPGISAEYGYGSGFFQPTDQPTLKNYGNSCYQNALLTSLAFSMTNDTLNAMSRVETQARTPVERSRAKLRNAFFDLAKALRHSSEKLDEAQQRFHAASKVLQIVESRNSRWGSYQQQDAQEYLSWLSEALGMNDLPSSSMDLGSFLSYEYADSTQKRLSHNKNESSCLLLVGMDPNRLEEKQIVSIRELLNEGLLGSDTLEGENAYLLDNEELQRLGIGTGEGPSEVRVPGQKQSILIHKNPERLKEIILLVKTYQSQTTQLSKITSTIPLHEEDLTLSLPVYAEGEQQPVAVDMSLGSIVLHRGTLNAGHYIAAVRRGDSWTLFDDQAGSSVQLSPPESGQSSISALINYMKAMRLTPYLLHYRRNTDLR